jgi:hypothetical protein
VTKVVAMKQRTMVYTSILVSRYQRLNCSQFVTLSDYVIWLLNIENGEMVRVIPSEDNTQKGRFTVGHGRRMEKASIHLAYDNIIHLAKF